MTRLINHHRTWWGIGYKYGGFLIAAGFETLEGYIYHSKSLSWREKFTLTNVRLGLGLGGGAGAVIIAAFNTPSLAALDGMQINDWGVNISLGSKISAMVNAMSKRELLPSDMEQVRTGLQIMYNELDIAAGGDKPKVVCWDVGGFGAELSANYVTGKFEIEWGV